MSHKKKLEERGFLRSTILSSNKNIRFLRVSIDPVHDCQKVIATVLENI